MSLTLHGMDSKTLRIVFTPNFPKPAVGKILISHYSSLRDSREISGLGKRVKDFNR